jgi:nucleotide-binding universal stress UspA family protein
MRTILVAVDFSPVTRLLLDATIRVADIGTKIYLVHVAAPEPDFVGYSVGPQYIRDDRANELREEHTILNEYKDELIHKGLDVEALLVGGPTVETLLGEIEKLNAELLIIGRKGHSKIFEVVIGSVCNDLMHKLPIPALVIPEPEANK